MVVPSKICVQGAMKTTVLNCIDLSNPDVHQSVSLLKQACLDSGFFYIVNHGISQDSMDEVFAQSRRMFEQPLSEKMKHLRNEKHRGYTYTPILDELLDPENQFKGDYKEGYYIGEEVAEGDPKAEKPFYGPNVWPERELLPGWRETMEKFHREALEVARAVARIIALAPDLKGGVFLLGGISDPSKGIFGAGAHSDYGLITLLTTDGVSDSQVSKYAKIGMLNLRYGKMYHH